MGLSQLIRSLVSYVDNRIIDRLYRKKDNDTDECLYKKLIFWLLIILDDFM